MVGKIDVELLFVQPQNLSSRQEAALQRNFAENEEKSVDLRFCSLSKLLRNVPAP